MPKSSDAKVELTKKLLSAGIPYREIQDILNKTFGSGMSYTTFQKLAQKEDEMEILREELGKSKLELEKTRHDLALYKHLYFELLQSVKKDE